MRALLLTAAALGVAGCSTVSDVTPTTAPPAAASTSAPAANVLAAEWTGPYGGVPPFDRVRIADFEPAVRAAMAEHLAEIDAIASNPAAPTFANTLEAMERAGRTLDRVSTVYSVWGSNYSTPEFQAVEAVVDPLFAAHADRITQNAALFARIEAVHAARETSGLTAEQQRLVSERHTDFVRAGARLDDAAKTRLSAINQELSGLYTAFSQDVLADETDLALVLETQADLAGLSEGQVAAFAAEAARRGMPGRWVVANTRSSIDPFLEASTRRDLRERAWRLFASRGDTGNDHDTNASITRILALRAERANLLGYPTHAHWRLDNAMAGTPERALELMEAVWTPAVARVREEVADMQAVADREGADLTIEPWDYRFYAEKVRSERYNLDPEAVRPYLQLENLREGLFWTAGELFGYAFTPATDVPVPHPDVRVWAVSNRETGAPVGLWYFDPYARPGKRSGAWMSAYRSQERLDGEITTIVSNNSNFTKPPAGQPVLISWDDAETLFHEFGHALHGLSSNVTYPSLSGTSVARDYVEFPSQLLERWLSTPEVLQRFALHAETGAPIPLETVERLREAGTFNQGFGTVEFLASALVDMRAHLEGTTPVDPDAFERETLAGYGMPPEIGMRHRMPQFLHLFSGDGYSAGYYSYLWADVITADAFEAFTEAGGPYDPAVARRLWDHVFSVGNTVDPAEGYRAFRGHDPAVGALMRARGFPVPAE
ncbi:MAG TPA: M3 family metallopeptidase [Rubricoccaceae bacterium]|jgi:peptidyl-dipeptidase Dcp